MKKRIDKIKNIVDLDYYLNYKTNNEEINNYYKHSRKLYRLFQSNTGCMHFVIDHGNGKKATIYEQANIISKHFNSKTRRVLELGSGQGGNIKYLANKNKNIDFYGIDIFINDTTKNKNKIFSHGDYHDLSQFDDNYFDVIFAIETICYSENKEKIFNEVNRVLKKEGIFIVFDGYSNVEKNNLDEYDLLAMKLTDSGMALNEFENIKTFDIKRKNFELIEKKNFTKNIFPNLRRFEKRSDLFFNSKILSKMVPKIVSKQSIGNVITGNLVHGLFKKNYYVYYMHIYRNIK